MMKRMTQNEFRVYSLVGAVAVIIVLIIVLFALIFSSCSSNKKSTVEEEVTTENLITTPPPQPVVISVDEYENLLTDSDLYWLARIMEAEDGHCWSDENIMKIGEVALNRVASPAFPDTVKEVALQGTEDLNDDIPTQYEPFENYVEWTPKPYYIYLAARLMNGERIFDDPDVIWQALFVQGEIVDELEDTFMGTTTYFCK